MIQPPVSCREIMPHTRRKCGHHRLHEPLRVQQLLLYNLGKGVFRRWDPSRRVPRSLRDTGRLAVDSTFTAGVLGYLVLLGPPKNK